MTYMTRLTLNKVRRSPRAPATTSSFSWSHAWGNNRKKHPLGRPHLLKQKYEPNWLRKLTPKNLGKDKGKRQTTNRSSDEKRNDTALDPLLRDEFVVEANTF